MRAKSMFASFGAIAVVVAATGFGVSANEDSARGRSNDVIKSATVVNNAQKYRPKSGCFATGTRDTSGNFQTVC
jgi:hypothetical protein